MTRGVGGGGRLFEGGDYFKYFHQRGAIIRGKAFIQGNTVVSSLIYISSVIDKVQCLRKKGKTVTPSRRLHAKGETSTLQTSKYTNIIRKIYQSSRFNNKNAFTK